MTPPSSAQQCYRRGDGIGAGVAKSAISTPSGARGQPPKPGSISQVNFSADILFILLNLFMFIVFV